MSNITTNTNNTRIPTYFTFDHFNKKIVGSEQNFKMSGNPNKPQYAALLVAMEAHPNYELSAVAPKVKKQTYAGLNCELILNILSSFSRNFPPITTENIYIKLIFLPMIFSVKSVYPLPHPSQMRA